MDQPKTLIVVICLLTAAIVGLSWFSGERGRKVGSSDLVPVQSSLRVDDDVLVQTHPVPVPPAKQLVVTTPLATPSSDAQTTDTVDPDQLSQPSPTQVQRLMDAMAVEIEYTDQEIELDIDDLTFELDRLQSAEDFARLAGETDLPDALDD